MTQRYDDLRRTVRIFFDAFHIVRAAKPCQSIAVNGHVLVSVQHYRNEPSVITFASVDGSPATFRGVAEHDVVETHTS